MKNLFQIEELETRLELQTDDCDPNPETFVDDNATIADGGDLWN